MTAPVSYRLFKLRQRELDQARLREIFNERSVLTGLVLQARREHNDADRQIYLAALVHLDTEGRELAQRAHPAGKGA